MTRLARNLPQTTHSCPKCSFPLGLNSTTCENCGSFVPLEDASDISHFVKAIFGKRLNEIPPSDIAFYLACIPLLIGPPVAAIVIAGVKILQDRSRLHLPAWRKPIGIAVVNILISLLIWRYAATQVSDTIHGTIHDALYGLRDLFWFRPSDMVKPTPI